MFSSPATLAKERELASLRAELELFEAQSKADLSNGGRNTDAPANHAADSAPAAGSAPHPPGTFSSPAMLAKERELAGLRAELAAINAAAAAGPTQRNLSTELYSAQPSPAGEFYSAQHSPASAAAAAGLGLQMDLRHPGSSGAAGALDQSMPVSVVIFGATGDLAKKKLFPALYQLILLGERTATPPSALGRFVNRDGEGVPAA